jgi:2-iminobutanoate/2-iminopropanoate deaminase
VVETAGGALTDIGKVNVYVTDMALWPEFNRIYAEVFGAHRPARAVVPVPALNYGMKLEVEAVAVLGGVA